MGMNLVSTGIEMFKMALCVLSKSHTRLVGFKKAEKIRNDNYNYALAA